MNDKKPGPTAPEMHQFTRDAVAQLTSAVIDNLPHIPGARPGSLGSIVSSMLCEAQRVATQFKFMQDTMGLDMGRMLEFIGYFYDESMKDATSDVMPPEKVRAELGGLLNETLEVAFTHHGFNKEGA